MKNEQLKRDWEMMSGWEALAVLKERATVAACANEAVNGARDAYPTLSCDSTRETLIAWLCTVDRNGCWTDRDMVSEGWDPMTIDEAWEQVDMMTEDTRDNAEALAQELLRHASAVRDALQGLHEVWSSNLTEASDIMGTPSVNEHYPLGHDLDEVVLMAGEWVSALKEDGGNR